MAPDFVAITNLLLSNVLFDSFDKKWNCKFPSKSETFAEQRAHISNNGCNNIFNLSIFSNTYNSYFYIKK